MSATCEDRGEGRGARGEKVFVYTGPHYGRVHYVVERQGRYLIVQHREGKPLRVPACDVEVAS